MFFVVRRATLLVPSGPPRDPARRHLFICLTDPAGRQREVLLVCVTTLRDGLPGDRTCALAPGEHSFITRASYADYRFARIEAATRVERAVKCGWFGALEPVAPAVFERVSRGFERSPFVAPNLLEFYRCNSQICRSAPQMDVVPCPSPPYSGAVRGNWPHCRLEEVRPSAAALLPQSSGTRRCRKHRRAPDQSQPVNEADHG